MLEALIIDLGVSVAKTVLKIWVGDPEIVTSTAADIGDLVAGRVGSVLTERKTARTFARIAEEVAQALDARLRVEYGGLADNEKNAAIIAVATTLDATPLSTQLLMAADLDPLRLETAYRQGTPDAANRALLRPEAIEFYDRLLEEVCEYVVALTISLPQFEARATVELLQRETELLQIAKAVLTNLPRQEVSFAPDGDNFETRYRRAVVRKLDRLELFGLTVSEFSRRYKLNVAYITLTATATGSGKRLHREHSLDISGAATSRTQRPHAVAARTGATPAEELYVRVDSVIATSPRCLIRGEAGSGKTTLLQYLAVRSSSQSFEKPLTDLNDAIPFFLQLRRYARGALPQPQQFIAAVAPELAGIMPQGWVHAQLECGRALILIDGVDELPRDRRREVRTWISDIHDAFPTARYIVTSRPPAVDEDWLSADGFATTELQPMAPSDIVAFIDHWHEAAAADMVDTDELTELDRLKRRLQSAVRETPPIRALATSPLLCAMLCALNRDRKAQLPKDRLELYRISLETLLDRRDIERELETEVGGDLSLPVKELLLQDLAYWLLRNGWADVEKDAAVNRFFLKLKSMPHAPESGQAVFEVLLERSGILLEPVPGRIDFVHRTFQEYLAAKQAVAEDDVGVLLAHATEDEWREIVILAAGHARLNQRVSLISGLLERGRVEPEWRHLLHLLAVACLETSPELPPQLAAELRECLSELVPPTNMTEARALSSAGELAVPLLAAHRRERVEIATACVRALALIGGDLALEVLARFGADSRLTVHREIVRAWRSFDPERYAELVLTDTEFSRGLVIDDLEQVPALRYLRRLHHLTVDGSRSPRSVQSVDLDCVSRRADSLTALSLYNARTVNFAALGRLKGLVSLELMRCRDIGHLAPVADLANLRELWVWHCSGVESVAPLGALELEHCAVAGLPLVTDWPSAASQTLRSLFISECGESSLSGLEAAPALVSLVVQRTNVTGDLAPLSALTSLVDLRLGRLVEAVRLEELSTSMKVFMIQSAPVLADLAALGSLTGLRELVIREAPQVADVSALRALTALTELHLRGTTTADLTPVAGLASLRHLAVERCEQLRDLTPLASLRRLRTLSLLGCANISDLEPLGRMTQLQHLDIEGCVLVTDLSPLASLRSLRTVDVTNCAPQLDVLPLTSRGVQVFGRSDARRSRSGRVLRRPTVGGRAGTAR